MELEAAQRTLDAIEAGDLRSKRSRSREEHRDRARARELELLGDRILARVEELLEEEPGFEVETLPYLLRSVARRVEVETRGVVTAPRPSAWGPEEPSGPREPLEYRVSPRGR